MGTDNIAVVTPPSVKAVRLFLARCRRARSSQTAGRARELSEDLRRLQQSLHTALQERASRSCLLAPHFNIFNVLGVADQERIHSNFLRELLDPRGSHGQGSLFLASFLEMCRLQVKTDTCADGLWVRREAAVLRGRCDLLIHSPGHLCVLIENKIKSPEGDTQLVRYRDWLARRREPAKNKRLIFLTVQGIRAKSIDHREYVKLSYVQDIRRWLEESKTSINAAHVRSLVDNYLDLFIEQGRREDAKTTA